MSQIIINGSHQIGGNTSILIQKLYPNHNVLNLIDYKIELYNYDEVYSDQDEFLTIIDKILQHDEIIFATPVYWYAMSSLLKVFFDRITDLLTTGNPIGYQLKNIKVKVITTSNGNHLNDLFFEPIIATCNYLGMEFINGEHYVNPISLT